MKFQDPFSEPESMDATEAGTMFAVSATVQVGKQAERLADVDSPRYEPIQELGKGAMGEVWLMRDIYLRRKVASKQLLPELNAPEVQAQFLNEVQITARLEHPGVVPVYTLEVDAEGRLSYTMKVVQGKTLKQEISALKDSLQTHLDRRYWQQELFRLLEIFLKVCDALSYAHSKGIIHRDLKPANIMIGPFREVYIVDWGLAQVWNQSETEVQEPGPRVIAGTPRYLSPEQARCLCLSPASDQFTMGLILQEIITLAPAFQASSMPEMLKKILKGQRAPCRQALGLYPVPEDLQAIVARATALKADERYASVAELATDVRHFLQDVETTVRPDNLLRKALRWIRRHSQQALLGSLLILLICSLAVAGSLWIWQQTLVQTQRRRAVLEELQHKMTLTGQMLDSYLSGFEAQLEFLAGASAESWQRGRALPGQVLQPQQLLASGAGAVELFWERPLWLGAARPVSRLKSLDFIFQRVFAVSADPHGNIQSWLRSGQQADAPLAWASVDFSGGPQLIYPASLQALQVAQRLKQHSTLSDTEERSPTRPAWLGLMALNQQDYLVVQAPVLNDAQVLLGRASLLIRQESLARKLKEAPLRQGVSSLQVTDAQGRRLFSRDALSEKDTQWPQALSEALRSGKSGWYETPQGLYTCQALATSDWRLVVRVDFQQLLQQQGDFHE